MHSGLTLAIRYLNQVRPEPDILRGLVQQSRHLATLLENEPHSETPVARLHLNEIDTLASSVLTELETGTDPSAPHLAPLTDQLRIHETGALDAINLIIDDHQREIVATLRQSLVLLIAMAMVVAAVGCLGFWLFIRRILHPLHQFADGVRRFGDAEDSLRISVDSDDELGDIARLFNQAIDQRGAYQQKLRERIKEQHCLYRVLELTTDDKRTVADACHETAQLIPPGLLHEDAAMARIRHGEETFSSRHWTEPVAACIDSPIRVRGNVVGRVEAAYSRALPDQPGGEGPFLAEERALLDSIAMHLARMLQDRKVREELARNQRLQAVGELTGGIAHDFNNLLTVIQGNAEALEELHHDRDDETVELAEMIETAAQRAAELTRRLLAFSRRQALEPRSTDINQLIKEMQGLLKRTLGEHVEAEFAFDTGLWPALIDPAQLETALLNLIVNARDAMAGGGKLTIETRNVELDADYAALRTEVTPGDYVLVAVSDTGGGIAPELLERVFEPFFTTKTEAHGTGLGLSMVHGFVNQSGGHVAVYSEPDEGTTVRLYLPRAETEAEPLKKPELDAMPGGDANVLLVEDDALVRRYTCDQLIILGYQVQTAVDGREAKAMLESSEPIDVLLTDVVMPGGISGHELARLAVALRPGLKVLYMSGYTENAIVHHGRLDPGVALLSKPFRRADLARKMREVLSGED
ncbi:MAG: ATP-binding protein [Gammaproteobacteria bacterium]|nr:ATP-binding protein [Gammaproteobacteria bacterium]